MREQDRVSHLKKTCLSKTLVVVFRVLRLRRNTHWYFTNASFDCLQFAGLRHFGKKWIVLTGLTDSSTRAGTGCTDLQLIDSSVADCQALT